MTKSANGPWSVQKRIGIAIGLLIGIPAGLVLAGVALFFAFIFAWFNAGAFYSGDGQYRRGVGGAAFQVEFPPLDLSTPGKRTFTFTRLAPPIGYTVGLKFPDARRTSAVVAITLRNERGDVVFAEKRPLLEWTWRRNMAVINGRSVEVPIGGGSVRIESKGVGPDGGWGTHFSPRWSGRYTLTIQVTQPDPAARGLLARPVIEGYTASF